LRHRLQPRPACSSLILCEPHRGAVLAALLATSAGALIYVGASHLLPTAEREPQRYSLVALGLGVLLAAGIIATHR
jgi:zinc transporter ZupT